MLADAVSTHGLDRKGLVARLKREPQLLAGLGKHQAVITPVRSLNIQIGLVTPDLLETAAGLSTQLCLLTNDALTIATMKKLGLTDLATNDDDFDRVDGITVWKPRQLKRMCWVLQCGASIRLTSPGSSPVSSHRSKDYMSIRGAGRAILKL